jgi:hypothetical protein
MKTINGKERIKIGTDSNGETIFMDKPTFDCEWYWSFGYLGNKNMHYHLEAYQSKDRHFTTDKGEFVCLTEKRNLCMRDCLEADYDLVDSVKDNLWQFCELALTIYALKKTAEVLGRGGSHMTTNPCKEVIKNAEEVKRLNEVVIPELCQTLWDLIS